MKSLWSLPATCKSSSCSRPSADSVVFSPDSRPGKLYTVPSPLLPVSSTSTAGATTHGVRPQTCPASGALLGWAAHAAQAPVTQTVEDLGSVDRVRAVLAAGGSYGFFQVTLDSCLYQYIDKPDHTYERLTTRP